MGLSSGVSYGRTMQSHQGGLLPLASGLLLEAATFYSAEMFNPGLVDVRFMNYVRDAVIPSIALRPLRDAPSSMVNRNRGTSKSYFLETCRSCRRLYPGYSYKPSIRPLSSALTGRR